MAGLKLSHIYKVYPGGTKAVNDFTMEIEDKEFIVFVGPSGCGKSTTLRMIAGLEQITSGELSIGGTVVNYVEPRNRDIAMVFQNYALYPHMTVYDNMAFSLKIHKLSKEEIDRRVRNAAEILGITDYLDRKPKAMSGGQCQRVALGRAIVREPKVFLLDEPLSNLDAKLRTAMRSEISKLHHKLGTTFIYVTHDQVEAMTMGTRIVVMKQGFIQQIDTPSNLYKYPGNKFVAGFIGTPQMNFYDGTLLLNGDKVTIKMAATANEWEAPYEYFTKADKRYLDGQKMLTLGIRAEHISIDPQKYPYKAKCCVSYTEELGTECLVYADFNVESADSISETPTRVIIKAPAETKFGPGEIIEISLDLSYLQAFDKETENNIAPRIPQEVLAEGEVKDGALKILSSSIGLPEAMRTFDGKYTVTIPTSAVTAGTMLNAEVIKKEKINLQTLYHLKVGTSILFALDLPAGDNNITSIDIDLKQLTLSDSDGVRVSPVPAYSSLTGNFVREKTVSEQEADGKIKKVKGFAYKFIIEGVPFNCPEEIANRILSGTDKSIFKKELEFRFAPDAVALQEGGIAAAVLRIADYGREKFATCRVGEKQVVVKVGEGFAADSVGICPDVARLTIIEKDRDIRLI